MHPSWPACFIICLAKINLFQQSTSFFLSSSSLATAFWAFVLAAMMSLYCFLFLASALRMAAAIFLPSVSLPLASFLAFRSAAAWVLVSIFPVRRGQTPGGAKVWELTNPSSLLLLPFKATPAMFVERTLDVARTEGTRRLREVGLVGSWWGLKRTCFLGRLWRQLLGKVVEMMCVVCQHPVFGNSNFYLPAKEGSWHGENAFDLQVWPLGNK